MNAHSPQCAREQAALLREFIHENAGFVRIQADLAQTYAELGDDAGLRYALRKLVAHVKAATSSFNDLVTLRAIEPPEKGGAD
jgi:hypothetical protein